MFAFLLIWIGQLISVLASSMSHFALTLWMYEQTHSATAMGLMQVFFITPFLIMSIPAGVMVDRYNRKLMMMVSDLAAVLATGLILVLYALGRLEFWHLYIAAMLNGLGNTFQWPAYSAAISTMVPKEHLGRANGLMSLMEAGPAVLAPTLAGVLYPIIGLTGLLTLDVLTFFLAIATLAFVIVPQPVTPTENVPQEDHLWQEALWGFRYIFARPSLLGMQLLFLVGNLFAGMIFTLFPPAILARSNQNTLLYGSLQTIGALGNIAGGVLMSIWGGLRRRAHGVIFGWMLSGIFLFSAGLWGSKQNWLIVSIALFLADLVTPLINASNQALWQAKVAPHIQGRVFSARRLIAWFTQPIAPIIAGTLADLIAEPFMSRSDRAPSILLRVFGYGPGTGMSLLIVLFSFGIILTALTAFFIPTLREADTLLPDHEHLPGEQIPTEA